MENILEFMESNRERYLAELKELLAIPSVSSQSDRKPEMRRAAEWLKNPTEYVLPIYVSDMVTLIARLDVERVGPDRRRPARLGCGENPGDGERAQVSGSQGRCGFPALSRRVHQRRPDRRLRRPHAGQAPAREHGDRVHGGHEGRGVRRGARRGGRATSRRNSA